MGLLSLSALVGICLGSGLWLMFVRLPIMRQHSFADRIAPQLKSVNVGSRLLASQAVTPFGPLERIARPIARDAVTWLNRFSPASSVLARRLEQAGRSQSVLDFRAEQVMCGSVGFAASTIAILTLAASGNFNPMLAVLVIVGSAAGGYLLRDYLLGLEIRKRESRMLAEFPSLAELMALAVSAGESATGALERICRTGQGELAREFDRVLAETRAGTPLMQSLQNFSTRTKLAPLVRFVDGISVAIERGTPLAEVLRAQAQDVRDLSKRELMESAGRKEIAMMVPLVFGVLPLTVLFAVYPGIALINLGL